MGASLTELSNRGGGKFDSRIRGFLAQAHAFALRTLPTRCELCGERCDDSAPVPALHERPAAAACRLPRVRACRRPAVGFAAPASRTRQGHQHDRRTRVRLPARQAGAAVQVWSPARASPCPSAMRSPLPRSAPGQVVPPRSAGPAAALARAAARTRLQSVGRDRPRRVATDRTRRFAMPSPGRSIGHRRRRCHGASAGATCAAPSRPRPVPPVGTSRSSTT